MKIFLSYRFTGENPQILKETLSQIVTALNASGHQVWNSLDSQDRYIKDKFDNHGIMQDALKNLDQADALLAFINSSEKSEGMLLEIGYALAKKKKFLLAIRKDIKTTSLRQLADTVIEFSDLEDLSNKISQIYAS